jgi:Fic family protein
MTRRFDTGHYQPQIGGYSAFIPGALPSGETYDLTPAISALNSKADRAVARLDGSIDNLPDADIFVLSYIRKEAVVSSQIEGTQASLGDVLKAEAKIFDPRQPADVSEVINHIGSMRYALNEIQQRPITTNLICEMHQRLMRDVRGGEKQPGSIRETQNWIGAEGSSVGEAIFVPPPPTMVRDCMADLERFINEDQNLPLLVKTALAHAQFETIHPFLDGNGRVGRMLITLMLSHAEALSKPVLYISHYFRRCRAEYTDRLQTIRDTGDWDSWIEFFLTAVIEVSEDATRVSRAIVQLREAHRAQIIEAMPRGAGNALRLHEKLFSLPLITVPGAQNYLDMTFAGANNLVSKLTELGIIIEITGSTRRRVFMYESYFRLFEPLP